MLDRISPDFMQVLDTFFFIATNRWSLVEPIFTVSLPSVIKPPTNRTRPAFGAIGRGYPEERDESKLNY